MYNTYIKYINCLYKKIYLSKKKNDTDYQNNKKQCDFFLTKIYQEVKQIIEILKHNKDDKSYDEFLCNIAKTYGYDEWIKNVKINENSHIYAINN
jgi:hypothetical protein